MSRRCRQNESPHPPFTGHPALHLLPRAVFTAARELSPLVPVHTTPPAQKHSVFRCGQVLNVMMSSAGFLSLRRVNKDILSFSSPEEQHCRWKAAVPTSDWQEHIKLHTSPSSGVHAGRWVSLWTTGLDWLILISFTNTTESVRRADLHTGRAARVALPVQGMIRCL